MTSSSGLGSREDLKRGMSQGACGRPGKQEARAAAKAPASGLEKLDWNRSPSTTSLTDSYQEQIKYLSLEKA